MIGGKADYLVSYFCDAVDKFGGLGVKVYVVLGNEQIHGFFHLVTMEIWTEILAERVDAARFGVLVQKGSHLLAGEFLIHG